VWIAGFETGQVFVHLEAFDEAPALGIMVAEELEGVHEFGITVDNSFHELDFDIKVPPFLAGHFLTNWLFDRHTTLRIVPNWPGQVKGWRSEKLNKFWRRSNGRRLS